MIPDEMCHSIGNGKRNGMVERRVNDTVDPADAVGENLLQEFLKQEQSWNIPSHLPRQQETPNLRYDVHSTEQRSRNAINTYHCVIVGWINGLKHDGAGQIIAFWNRENGGDDPTSIV